MSLQLALPPVATRNGLACLLLESLIFTHRLGGRAGFVLQERISLVAEELQEFRVHLWVFLFAVSTGRVAKYAANCSI